MMGAGTLCPGEDELRAMIDGTLPQPRQGELNDHIETCELCQRTIESLVAGKDSWSGMADQLAQRDADPDAALERVIEKAKNGSHLGETAGESPGSYSQTLDFLEPPQQEGTLGRLGHYDVIELVGRGGMGVVLKGFDTSLRRVVAIKVLAGHLAASATAQRRFVREAQAAAAVVHDHVVAIHAVEESHEPPYFVMQFIEGKTLEERVHKHGPLELKEILRIGSQAASGLAAAHAQGLVHRDIKPANILLENGVERVKITDFGLARAADDASLTQSGVVAGTPQYMSPEQASGDDVDHRADLFSLGSVLCFMCTGRPPFRASTTMGVLKRVCEESARPIRESNPDLPDWLDAIISKLHAKNRALRFQSAREVAELLEAHLAHLQQPTLVPRPEPVTLPGSGSLSTTPVPGTLASSHIPSAEPIVRTSEIQRQVGRPATLLLVTGILNWIFLVLAILILGTMMISGPKPAQEALQAMWIVVPVLFVGSGLIIFGSCRMMEADSYGWSITAAVLSMVIGPGYIVGWPAGIWALAVLVRPEVREAFNRVRSDRDRRKQAASSGWDPRGQKTGWLVRCRSCGRTGSLEAVGGVRVGAASVGKHTVVWCTTCRRRRWASVEWGELPAHDPAAPQFLPHERSIWRWLTLAAGLVAGISLLWYVVSRSSFITVEKGGAEPNAEAGIAQLAGGAELDQLVALAEEKLQRVQKLVQVQAAANTEADTAEIEVLAARVRRARSHGDLSEASSQLRRLVEIREKQLARIEAIVKAKGAPASERAAAEQQLIEARLELKNAEASGHLGHDPHPAGAVTTRHGAEATNTSAPVATLLLDDAGAWNLAASPDGGKFAAIGANGAIGSVIKIWDTASLSELLTLREARQIHDLAFLADGKRMATAESDRRIRLRDVATGAILTEFEQLTDPTLVLAASRDGETLASAGEDKLVRVWELKTNQVRRVLTGVSNPIISVAISPDGKYIAAGTQGDRGGEVRVWDLELGQTIFSWGEAGDRIASLAFSPDGEQLAAASWDRIVYLWNVRTGEDAGRTRGHTDHVRAVAFSPNGSSYSTASSDSSAMLFDAKTHNRLATFEARANQCFDVLFIESGSKLATAHRDGRVRIWAIPSGM